MRIQRIRNAANETNYCPSCQADARLLADRALSRLLREDWPRTIEDLEDQRRKPRPPSCLLSSYFFSPSSAPFTARAPAAGSQDAMHHWASQ